jgi:hypothetical protein
MDEKRRLAITRPMRRNRPLIAVALLAIGLYTFWRVLPGLVADYGWDADTAAGLRKEFNDGAVQATNALVPLEAHIMSKCPDAKVSRRR